MKRVIVCVTSGGVRLDVTLAQKTGLTRTCIQRLLRSGHVLKKDCSEKKLKAHNLLQKGERYEVLVPEPMPTDLQPEDVFFKIVFEDKDIVVVDKPAGLVVHPAPGHFSGTLVHGLLRHCKDLSGIGGVQRPGIVHRLDKGTSGLLVVAKHDKAHLTLQKQFQKRTLGRFYQALVYGRPQPLKGVIEVSLGRHPVHRKKQAVRTGGRYAKTFYQTIEVREEGQFSHICCRLLTGRTHQIRVHCAHIGHAILGDELYGPRSLDGLKKNLLKNVWSYDRPALHASHLYFLHPETKKYMCFESPWPQAWERLDLKLAPYSHGVLHH